MTQRNPRLHQLGRFILAILTWLPLVWTLVILLAAKFMYASHGMFKLSLAFRGALLTMAEWYVFYGGFLIWLVLLIVLTWKKTITAKRCTVYVLLTATGMLCACLALRYDVFGVSGVYLD